VRGRGAILVGADGAACGANEDLDRSKLGFFCEFSAVSGAA